ncbi:hypothetical protein BJX63DRAFT_431750 [Aspergillus granulosus]|uniref:Uncharacterized protein n=1 Tax=Aspergillus granulosus TaxID=176169 RepID=A0ABR4HEH8_9EURO
MRLPLIALGIVPIAVTAQECGSSFSLDAEDITSQEDLNALENECTILLSDYQITSDFAGPFVLPGIINASRIVGGSDGSGRSLDISSFEMPDLEFVDYLTLEQLDELETFSVPSLASAGSITLDVGSHIDIIDMPVLGETKALSLKGNLTDVSFGALHTVAYDLEVTNRRTTVPAETSMNVSFPALNSSDAIFIRGRASSVSLPELTSLAKPWQMTWESGSNFSLWGEAVALDLPKLATVEGSIAFEGNISSLLLPSLDLVLGNLTITAGDPLSIDIPELGYAEVIRLTGEIESVSLPGLVNWYELHVDSDLAIDCDAFMDEYDRVPQLRVVTCMSRGTIEDSDTTDDSTENSEEDDDPIAQDEDSAVESQDDTEDDQQNGDDTGSAPLNVKRSIGTTSATAFAVAGLAGLLF